ncbi:MAG: metallophosphoesterase [Clostridia bacterium]|nr:metallophosphoesterase [Clostridia bacterium]
MIYVTSDLHGYPFPKFKELLAKASFGDDDFLFILGDVIDRGGDGADYLKWLLVQPNAELIRGNHEDMLLACSFLFDEITEQSVRGLNASRMQLLQNWMRNGAEPTIRGLSRTDPETRADILQYLRETPLYDTVSVGDRDYLLTHSGLGNFQAGKKMREYSLHDLLWNRPLISDAYSADFVTVFGHTPTCCYGKEYSGKMIRTDTWIDVDTGVSYGLHPMLLRLDDEKEFYV